MKTKRIQASTVTEAMGKVKKELGPDAIILYTKKIKRIRFLPPFKKEFVEIVAALDEEPRLKKAEGLPPSVRVDTTPNQDEIEFRNLVDQLNQTSNLTTETSPVRKKSGPEAQANSFGERLGGDPLIPDVIKAIYYKLIQIDFKPDFSDRVVKTLLRDWYSSPDPLSRKELKEKLNAFFYEALSPFTFSGKLSNSKLITLVGPTGVGKTTTAAKLASKAVLEEEKSVALITTDTYRIAAVDQLKTYAKILNVPISVCYSMEDFQEALTLYQDVDLIIVDSAGRNYQQKKYVNELLQLIPFQDQMETYLVLSATSKEQDLERITNQFQTIPISHFIFTKLDETVSIGNLCQLMLSHSYGVTYFTNGQDVPDDILEADRQAFIDKLIEGIMNE